MKGLLITSSDELGGRIDVRLGGGGGEEMGSLKSTGLVNSTQRDIMGKYMPVHHRLVQNKNTNSKPELWQA